jgi:hypothetical protein
MIQMCVLTIHCGGSLAAVLAAWVDWAKESKQSGYFLESGNQWIMKQADMDIAGAK